MSDLGGKAAGLLALAKVAVVPAFVIASAEWMGTHAGDLDAAANRLLDSHGLKEPFAVRSSADGEDGQRSAFAGLYETKLGVRRQDVPAAMRSVTASLNSDRVSAYTAARGVDRPSPRMHVIVQEMVAADTAGVAFSQDPADSGRILIEAVRGIGEELVSGTATPDAVRMDRGSLELLERRPGRQYVLTTVHGTRERLSARDISAPRLSDAEAREIAQTVLSLEDAFPDAQHGLDVEWALENGALKLLQCRPITTPALNTRDTGGQSWRAHA